MHVRWPVLAAFLALPAAAGATTWSANWRTRAEYVDADAFARHALAPTSRLRAALRQEWQPSHLSAWVEIEAIAAFRDGYNSGANGHVDYPTVVDPDGAEVNQAAIAWSPDGWVFTVGRQRVLYDNQRFVGNSGWRQNEQTFDAFDVVHRTGAMEWRYTRLDRVHRVAGDRARDARQREHDLAGHLLHVAAPLAHGTVAAYAYAIDDDTVPAASADTVGLRWSTTPGATWLATLDVARQSSHGSHGYHLIEGGWNRAGVIAKLGLERLGGDGHAALQTPLATLHAFNGWADVFATTPAQGLRDRYATLGGALPAALPWTISFHEFRSDRGNVDFGKEWDASMAWAFAPHWSALFKVARYEGAVADADVTKVWLQCEWTH